MRVIEMQSAVADPRKRVEEQKVQVARFARVPFGLVIIPFILNMVLREHFGSNENP